VKKIVTRGLGVRAVLWHAGMMLAYAGVPFAAAVWRFDVE
jgi:hypothetical protein